MKHYKVDFNDYGLQQFNKLDNSIKQQVMKLLKKLENTDKPQAYGKPLSNNYKNHWTYKVSNFRIIAEINDNKLLVLVVDVDRRAIVYKNKKKK